ncbi:hypothetical protein FOQG_11399, partial [Fusarium oxysporum f. sp. raphani 54005]
MSPHRNQPTSPFPLGRSVWAVPLLEMTRTGDSKPKPNFQILTKGSLGPKKSASQPFFRFVSCIPCTTKQIIPIPRSIFKMDIVTFDRLSRQKGVILAMILLVLVGLVIHIYALIFSPAYGTLKVGRTLIPSTPPQF